MVTSIDIYQVIVHIQEVLLSCIKNTSFRRGSYNGQRGWEKGTYVVTNDLSPSFHFLHHRPMPLMHPLRRFRNTKTSHSQPSRNLTPPWSRTSSRWELTNRDGIERWMIWNWKTHTFKSLITNLNPKFTLTHAKHLPFWRYIVIQSVWYPKAFVCFTYVLLHTACCMRTY